jgi:tetratricopeptide (TPR) repeat protein
MAMCKEDLKNKYNKLKRFKFLEYFNKFNEFALTTAPFVLIILAICLMYIFADTLTWNLNSIPFIVTLFSFSFGVLLAVNQYSLKAKAEKIEHEVRLLTLFSEFMEIAHAYGEPFVVKDKIEIAPKGIAAQDAAIAAISTLGNKYNDILGAAANQGLESLIFKSNVVGKYQDNEEVYKKISKDFDKNLNIKEKYAKIWTKKGQELYDQGKYLDSVEAYNLAKQLYYNQISPDVERGLLNSKKNALKHQSGAKKFKDFWQKPGSQ